MRERIEAFRAQNRDNMDGPEKRPLWERRRGSSAAHPPMLAIGFTNASDRADRRRTGVPFGVAARGADLRLSGSHPPAAVTSLLGN